MRRLAFILLASSALTGGLAEPGSAADLPPPIYKAPPAPPPVMYLWTGFYVGGHAGYRWADAELTADAYSFDRHDPGNPFNIPARSETFHPNGGIFGLQGGYNHQFAPNWLLGLEVDISWGKNSDTHSFSTTDGFSSLTLTRTSTLQLGTQGSIRGRLGYVDGLWLLYVTAGVSFVHAQWSESWTPFTLLLGPPLPFAVSSSKTLTGGTVGIGFERILTRHLLIRLEYLFADYGKFNVPFPLTTNIGSFDVTTHVVRAALSYSFGP